MATEDYYTILGINREAIPDDIKKAYRKLALKYHPDKTKGDKEAEAKFKQINEAYQILSDPTRRRQYDQFGTADSSGFQSGWQGGDFSGFSRNFDFGDLGGFGDIFDTFFGGAAGGRGSRKSTNPESIKHGKDVEANLQISFTDAVFGTSKRVSINRSVVCEDCAGKGSADSKLVQCSVCRGSGQVKKIQKTIIGSFAQTYICEECRGLGEKPNKLCRQCHGEGRKSKSTMVDVEIPAGIDNGQTIKLSGLGEAGWRGGQLGDLYITVHILPSRDFQREGFDLYSAIEISYPIAVLGGEISIKSLTGKLTLKIPAGTKSGEVFRLKGKGVKYLNKSNYGDLLIKVEITVPSRLTLKQKRLLEELNDEFTNNK